jgi:hypothetical protein
MAERRKTIEEAFEKAIMRVLEASYNNSTGDVLKRVATA